MRRFKDLADLGLPRVISRQGLWAVWCLVCENVAFASAMKRATVQLGAYGGAVIAGSLTCREMRWQHTWLEVTVP